ncbi:unnamed protein product [Dicrocoelium dendriticum]|nr:unnamed protein product [Dicrocoelium dendriticum]
MPATVQLSGEKLGEFAVVSGAKRGFVLTPSLFHKYLHAMMSFTFEADCTYEVRVEHHIDGGLLNIRRSCARTLVCETTIRMSLFADDGALFAHSADELQHRIIVVDLTAANFGLTINRSQTVCLFQPSADLQSSILPRISMGAELLETTSRFCYLGSLMSTDQQLHIDLRIRVSKAAAALGKLEYRVWNNHQLTVDTKLNGTQIHGTVHSFIQQCNVDDVPARNAISRAVSTTVFAADSAQQIRRQSCGHGSDASKWIAYFS